MNFIASALAGKVMLDEIDDFVGKWHESPPNGQELPEFLGMTDAEYDAWVHEPDVLPYVILARKYGRPFEQMLKSAYEDRLAARTSPDMLATLATWVETHRE